MKSQFADYFCHDEDAPGYDADVRNEEDPIREGYGALLSWVAAKVAPRSRVLDLGAGTGNLDILLPPLGELVCVDVSSRMLDIARGKLQGKESVRFVVGDLLAYCETCKESFDHIVSTYAIHHLTDPEKSRLFEHTRRLLSRRGTAIFGDLMFLNEVEKAHILERHRNSGTGIDEAVREEFFWDLEHVLAALNRLEMAAETRQFSELSWGLHVRGR